MPTNAELDRLKPLLDRIVAALRPLEIWLFGSRARGQARPDSDYDLLAVVPDGTPEEDLHPIAAWSLVRGLGIPADVVPCTRAEFEEENNEIGTLAREAFLHGQRLYGRQRQSPHIPGNQFGKLAQTPHVNAR